MEKFDLKELKIAVINKDIKKIKEISNKEFSFSSIEEAMELKALIKEAVNILEEEKQKIKKDMDEIKKLKKFYSQNSTNFLNFKI